jgi:hypothetical protein
MNATEKTFETVLTRLEQQRAVLWQRGLPDFGAVRDFVHELDSCVALLNREAGVPADLDMLLRNTVVHSSFPILLLLEQDTPAALTFLVGEWRRTAEMLGALESGQDWTSFPSEVRERGALYLVPERELELLTLYNTAVFELLRSTENQGRGREILRNLMAQLALSYDQLGRAFSISGETVRRWERGSNEIPADRMAVLVEADAARKRLLTLFKPERISHVLRRKAGLFGDESALDWIYRGRIAEVADRYEMALAYQG